MNEMTFGRQLTLGFITAGFVLLVVAFSGYRSTHDLIEKDRWVQHSHHVRRQIREVLSTLQDAETGQRGYVVTGNDQYLDSYASGTTQVTRTLDELRKLVADDPAQLRRVDAMRPLLALKLADMKATVDARRAEGFDAAAKLVAGGDGKRSMDELRRYVAEMDANEAGLLDSRREETEGNAALAKNVISWGAVLGICMTAMVGIFIARSLRRQVSQAARDMRASSSALQTAANQQATGAKEQATAMTEIHTTMTELLATSRQIAESAQQVARVAGQTAASAKAGDLTVARAHDAIVGIKQQVDVVVQHMLDLGKKSQHIGAVLDIVAELSEQTNILAINATIEAAGAGEAGKRFAVVAEEIRQLADRVGGSTKEIRVLIDDVRGAVNATVIATETNAKAVDGGSKQFGEVAASFADIASLVDLTTQSAREIELSTKQQSTAVEQVNLAIASVTQGSRETETSATQTLQTAQQLASLSSNLLKLVDAGA